MRDRDLKPLPPSKITNPFFAVYITSFVRAVLGEIINALPPDVLVFSATTDGFITDADDPTISATQTGPLCDLYRQARTNLTGDANVLEKKHAVRALLGWRTRGQATLKAGKPNPDDASYHIIILARGGISLPPELLTPEQRNAHVVNLFFNRAPDDVIESQTLTSIRDMVQFDADLVEQQVVKRLSMEFDWKRRYFASPFRT